MSSASPSTSIEPGAAAAATAEAILLIDDDEGVRRAFARILSMAGYRLRVAADGEQGLAMLREFSPDAVLVDLTMPGMGGLDVLGEVNRLSPDTPVIVISGTGIVDDVVQALRRGAWDYVSKPVEDSRLLVKAVRRALERATLLRENREQRANLEQLNSRLSAAVEELREDQEAGRRVQFSLLPQDGFHVGKYKFARRLFPSQCLSGDFVDYFAAGDDHVVLYLADVSGHGAASAFVTAMVAALVGRHREAFARGESDLVLHPEKLLESLNSDLGLRKLHKHVTMFYGVVDLKSETLSFGTAGQYPYPLLDDGERVQILESSGRPLGLFPEARFTRHEVSLASVKRLLVPSDGVLEILPESNGLSRMERLSALLGRTTGMESLIEAMGIDPTAQYPDDVTLLLVERS
ncbi:MAG TPA: SpoIIE family protein phosphatase [Polyangiaceae bacterium]|jgi:serine phosphatase RsbU (regulator of sigma subunit)|nr:SpoIIE family protein phosphatase [Polyangiaceae bacterium]